MTLPANPAFDEQVLLLDDEVVALAARAGIPWPSNTPTLDPTEDEGLVAAAQRGVASLVLRSWVDRSAEDDLLEPLGSLSDVVLKGRPVFGTFSALADGRMDPFYGTTAVYEAEGSWVTEVITPSGAHYLMPTDRDRCLAQAGDVMERAAAAEAHSTDDAGIYLCFVSAPPPPGATDQSVRIARVRPGSLETGTLTEGSGFTPTESVPSGAQPALEFILGSLVASVATSERNADTPMGSPPH
jgi:hypothetical protein